jgi:hypothetical protein
MTVPKRPYLSRFFNSIREFAFFSGKPSEDGEPGVREKNDRVDVWISFFRDFPGPENGYLAILPSEAREKAVPFFPYFLYRLGPRASFDVIGQREPQSRRIDLFMDIEVL